MAREKTFDHPPRGHGALLAYDPVNDRFRVLEVESDDYPYLEVVLRSGSSGARVQLPSADNRSPNYPSLLVIGHLYGFAGTNWDRLRCTDQKLDTVLHGWDGSQARKLPLLWGFSDQYVERANFTSTGAAWTYANGTAVPAGEVWVVSCLRGRHTDAVARDTILIAHAGGQDVQIERNATLAGYALLPFDGQLTLVAGDYIRVAVASLAIGAAVDGYFFGYKMLVDQ